MKINTMSLKTPRGAAQLDDSYQGVYQHLEGERRTELSAELAGWRKTA